MRVCLGAGEDRAVQGGRDKVDEGSDARATHGDRVGLGRDHGAVDVGFVLREPRPQQGRVDIGGALKGVGEAKRRAGEGRTCVWGRAM